ncbi:MAG: uroporphyrinogen decarboxylase [Acidobacteria bacterium]|nr:uroporphyrinogen decarboxylase [Acidobacteriota bacterium]
MASLISRFHGVAQLAPAMAEVPLEQNVGAIRFGERLLRGEVAVTVFMTGVGTRTLMEVLQRRYRQRDLLGALARATLIARGPKPIAALRALGLSTVIPVPEPNTWREVLEVMDTSEGCPNLSGLTVAVQEYGTPNRPFLEELGKRGAEVLQVPVYRWTLPSDTGPLCRAIDGLIAGTCRVVLFTNSMQVSHLFQLANQQQKSDALRRALNDTVTASIGPNCSQALRRESVRVDLEAGQPNMARLVEEASRIAAGIPLGRGAPASSRVSVPVEVESETPPRQAYSLLDSSVFMRACRRQATEYTPIWLMRQAGRYMAEYREIRSRTSFLGLCKNSDLAAEVTVTAAHRLGVDAAIIFADILLIVEPMGLGLTFEGGDGPSIQGVIRSQAEVDRLSEVNPEESLSFVFEAVRKARAGLRPDLPLIGFAGAPFTLASYITEGGGSKNYVHTKELMYRHPGAWDAMMQLISRSVTRYLNGQIHAGAQAVQLFDSWAGCLSPEDYRRSVLPYTIQVIDNIRPRVPVIYFSTGTGGYLELVGSTGADVIGVDWRIDLAQARARIGGGQAVQGNLDPLVLLGDPDSIAEKAGEILDRAGGRPGHVFNLGHGILPQTPVDAVLRLVDAVQERSRRARSSG